MLRSALFALLLLPLLGCGEATLTEVVRLDAAPVERVVVTRRGPPVEISNTEFRKAMRWLAADAAAMTAIEPPRRQVLRVSFDAAPRDLLGAHLSQEYQSWCQQVRHGPTDCLEMGDSIGFEGKRRLALSLAMGSFIGGVADEVGEIMNPVKLEAMIVISMATYLLLLYAPEPVTKVAAGVLTLSLYIYLGDELSSVIDAYRRMQDDADEATTFSQLQAAGARFGHAIGEKVTRILIMLATARLGSRSELASKVQRLPRFGQALKAARFEPISLTGGGSQAATLPWMEVAGRMSEVVLGQGRLNLVLNSSAMAAVFGLPGGGTPRSKASPKHHICTNKNDEAEVRGGPWTPRFQDLFERAGMTLDDPDNIVEIEGHQGPHPEEYHAEVFRRLNEAMLKCRTVGECQIALRTALKQMARELQTPGSYLNRLVTKKY